MSQIFFNSEAGRAWERTSPPHPPEKKKHLFYIICFRKRFNSFPAPFLFLMWITVWLIVVTMYTTAPFTTHQSKAHWNVCVLRHCLRHLLSPVLLSFQFSAASASSAAFRIERYWIDRRVLDARFLRENCPASLVWVLASRDVNIRVFLEEACNLAEEWEAESKSIRVKHFRRLSITVE